MEYPISYTEALLITAAVDDHGRRDVAIFYILDAKLHTETDEYFIMLLEVPLAKLMVKLYPKIYRKYVTICSKGKLPLYMNMHKDIYGLLRSALFVYKELLIKLELYVFVINP